MRKPTESQDGEHRISVQVSHRIEGRDLVYILADMLDTINAIDYTPEDFRRHYRDEAAKVTKKALEEQMESRLFYDGIERLWTTVEEYHGNKRVAAAVERIREMYPTMTVDV